MCGPTDETLSPSSEAFYFSGGTSIEHLSKTEDLVCGAGYGSRLLGMIYCDMISPEGIRSSGESLVSMKSLSSLGAIMYSPTDETLSLSGEAFNFPCRTSIKAASKIGNLVFEVGYGSRLVGILYHMS